MAVPAMVCRNSRGASRLTKAGDPGMHHGQGQGTFGTAAGNPHMCAAPRDLGQGRWGGVGW